MNFFDQFKNEHLLIAHRGFRSLGAENTLKAFRLSRDRCDMFEFDIQYTKDKVAVVIHDDTLLRTTNVKDIVRFSSREPFYIKDFTLNEVEELDNGSWFYRDDPFGSIKNGEVKDVSEKANISKLDDILIFSTKESFKINLEIKDSLNCSSEYIAKDIVKKLDEFEAEDRCIISSFNHNYLHDIKKLKPKLHTAALFVENRLYDISSYLKSLNVDAYHINPHLAEKATIKSLKKEGIYTNVYTVNEKKEALKLFDMGVKGVFSDTLSYDSLRVLSPFL